MDQYLKDILKILGFAAGVATIPLIVAFAGLQPPWPPAALVMWEWARAAKRGIRRRLIIAGMVLTVIGIGAYLPLYSLYVVNVSHSKQRVVRGTVCTANAKLLYSNDCPDLPPEALPQAGWNADYLWTSGSIMRVRLGLVAGWLGFIAGLMAFVGAVIAGRPLTRTRRGAAAPNPE